MREAILSGLVTGLAIAMPVGAVAALIVALTVRTSFRVGLGAAVGVATVDGAYAAAAVVGGGLVAQVLAPIAQPLRIGFTVVLSGDRALAGRVRPAPASRARGADNGWVTDSAARLDDVRRDHGGEPGDGDLLRRDRARQPQPGRGRGRGHRVRDGRVPGQCLVAGARGRHAAPCSVVPLTGPRAHVVTGLVSGVAIAVLALRGLG